MGKDKLPLPNLRPSVIHALQESTNHKMKPLHTSALAAQKANTPMIAPHPVAEIVPLEDTTMSILLHTVLLIPPLAKSAEPENMQ